MKILAPVGSFTSLQAAIDAGADAIYCGVGKLNMRSRNGSFAYDDLFQIVERAHAATVAVHLTLNTVMYDADLGELAQLCQYAKECSVDAVICMDIAAIQIARKYGLRVHISTQQNISNIEAVKFFAQFADVIVLARELTLEQISKICSQIREQNICGPSGELVSIEVFIHGALCMAVSGKCGLSLGAYNSSANRGACVQVCRRSYTLSDTETGSELSLEGNYLLSPKDLCTIGMFEKFIEIGISIGKIEGRARSADYVATTVSVYKKAVALAQEKKLTVDEKNRFREQLLSVYNRGFWENGYYLGKKTGEWTNGSGNESTQRRNILGKVVNYYAKKGVASIFVDHDCENTQHLHIEGPTTGFLDVTSAQIMHDLGGRPLFLKRGMLVTVACAKVRKNDCVYMIFSKK